MLFLNNICFGKKVIVSAGYLWETWHLKVKKILYYLPFIAGSCFYKTTSAGSGTTVSEVVVYCYFIEKVLQNITKK